MAERSSSQSCVARLLIFGCMSVVVSALSGDEIREVMWRGSPLDVLTSGKMAVSWGELKRRSPK